MACKSSRKKKMFLGGIDPVSLATGALSLYNAARQKQNYNNQVSMANELAKESKLKLDTESLNNYDGQGTNKYFYRTGGIAKLNTRKGLLPLNEDGTIFEAIGPKHSNGGIDIGDVEIEGGEVVKLEGDNMKVLSDADNVLGYSPADNVKVTGNFNAEFNKQEQIKSKMGLKNDKNKATIGEFFKGVGSDIKNWVNDEDRLLTPDRVLDNVVNLGLTALTPKVPKPILQNPVRLESDIDVSPQLDTIKEGQLSTNRFIDRNISDANVASAISQQAKNNAVGQTNEVLSNELNTELQLRNQNKLLNSQIDSNNIAKLNENQQLNLERGLGINSALSANMANLSSDITAARNNESITKADNERLLTTLLRDTNGELANAVLIGTSFDDAIVNNYDALINSPYINDKMKDAIIRKHSKLTTK
jgi:hypothetical protein